jgi:tetratricopeptide (TPR) repeat protein
LAALPLAGGLIFCFNNSLAEKQFPMFLLFTLALVSVLAIVIFLCWGPGSAPLEGTRNYSSRPSWDYVLLVAISGSALCLAQQDPHGRGNELRDAATLLKNRQFPDAIGTYHKILKADPHNEKAVLGLAAAYFGVYNYDQTRRLLREAAAAHPESVAALVELGKLDIHLLHYDDAIVELKRAVRRSPGSAAAHEQLGVAYQAKGDEERALAQFNEAIRLAPDSGSTHYFRGTLYADHNDTERAYQDAKAAYRLEPNTQTRELFAKAALHGNKCDEAIGLLQTLADSEGVDPTDLYLLSRAYKCAGQDQRAQELQDEYVKRSQSVQESKTHKMHADHLATEAGELAVKNQLSPALALLSQALAEDPENGPALALQAKIDFSRGRVSESRQAIESALHADPYNPDYLYVLGKILEKQGETNHALDAFRTVTIVNPRESDAYFEIGQIYLQNGDRTRAVSALRSAVKYSPDDPDYRKALQQAETSSRKSP